MSYTPHTPKHIIVGHVLTNSRPALMPYTAQTP